MTHHHFIMFLAGVGVPIFAAMNARLGQHLGSPATAAMIMFIIGASAALFVSLVTKTAPLSAIIAAPKYLYPAGLLMALYLLSITWIAPVIGLGNAVFLVLIGQLFAAAMVDQFGLFGAIQKDVTMTRAAGLALMGVGVFLAQRG